MITKPHNNDSTPMLQFNNLFSIYIHLRLAVTNTQRSKQTKKKETALACARAQITGKMVSLMYSVWFKREPQLKNAMYHRQTHLLIIHILRALYTFSAILFLSVQFKLQKNYLPLPFVFNSFLLESFRQECCVTFMAPFVFKTYVNPV